MQLAESTEKLYAEAKTRRLTPRVRLAIQAWASGAVPTQNDAAQMAGIDPAYMSMLLAHNLEAKAMAVNIQQIILDETIDVSVVLKRLGRRAISNIAQTMETSGSELMRFKAAQDLADRSPSTSKTQKHIVASMQIEGKDVLELTRALAESAAIQEEFSEVAEGDFVRVDMDDSVDTNKLFKDATRPPGT